MGKDDTKRDKYYNSLAVWDKGLASTFETVTTGKPTAPIGKEGAQLILDTLLADGGISANEATVMDQLIREAKFDNPALRLLAEKLQEAIRGNEAFSKNVLQVPANSTAIEEFCAPLDLGTVNKIQFTSPGTKLSYRASQYLVIKAMLINGDITAYEPSVGPFLNNPLLGGVDAGQYRSDINRIIVFDSFNRIETATITVHEATHAIQDWLDIKSTVRFCEADAYVAAAVAAVALGWKKKDMKSTSILAVAFEKAATMVIAGKANDPSKADWQHAYKLVTDAVAKDNAYKNKIDGPCPLPEDKLPEGQSPERDRFNALLDRIEKKKP
jgi:polyhydroxyalkanoate synthesis regulator phasin